MIKKCANAIPVRGIDSGLNDSRYRRQLSPTAVCPDCKTPETAEHVLLRCPRYDQSRNACQDQLSRYGLALSYPLAMGRVELLQPKALQDDTLDATAKLLDAIDRISSRRN